MGIIEPLIKIVIIVGVIKLTVPFQILAERKISAWMQDRVGPNRCGPFGIIQPFADGIKLFFKEDFMPSGVDKVIYILGPCVAMFMAIAAFAVIPFGGTIEIGGRVINLQIVSVDVGLLYILAIGALSVYGVVLGGWASNSKYAFLGGLRAAAQMISYEVPLGLAVITMAMICGTLRLEEIVQQQMDGVWFVCTQPLTFLVFLICIFAETNRAPFDLAECEQELVAGFHTEYSSMKFAMFFLGEYAHMIIASAFAVTLFFGGWHLPYCTWLNESSYWLAGVMRFGVFYAKIWAFIFFFMCFTMNTFSNTKMCNIFTIWFNTFFFWISYHFCPFMNITIKSYLFCISIYWSRFTCILLTYLIYLYQDDSGPQADRTSDRTDRGGACW